MSSNPKNPDFSISAKRLIVKAVQKVLREPGDSTVSSRPTRIRPPKSSFPQYQFQVYSGVAQNQTGWDMVRAHPATS